MTYGEWKELWEPAVTRQNEHAQFFSVDRDAPTRFEMPAPRRSLRRRFMAAVHAFWEAWHS